MAVSQESKHSKGLFLAKLDTGCLELKTYSEASLGNGMLPYSFWLSAEFLIRWPAAVALTKPAWRARIHSEFPTDRVLLRWCNHGMTSHSLCQRLLASTTSQALSRLHEENHLLGEAPRGSGSGRPLTVSRTPEYLWLCWGRYDWDKFPVFPFAYLFSGCYVFYNSLYGKFSMPWQAIYSQIYLRTKVANFRDAVIPVETTIYVWI